MKKPSLETRIRAILGGQKYALSISVLVDRLGVERRKVDRVLSKMGTEVTWHRIGYGGDRFYTLRTRRDAR